MYPVFSKKTARNQRKVKKNLIILKNVCRWSFCDSTAMLWGQSLQTHEPKHCFAVKTTKPRLNHSQDKSVLRPRRARPVDIELISSLYLTILTLLLSRETLCV